MECFSSSFCPYCDVPSIVAGAASCQHLFMVHISFKYWSMSIIFWQDGLCLIPDCLLMDVCLDSILDIIESYCIHLYFMENMYSFNVWVINLRTCRNNYEQSRKVHKSKKLQAVIDWLFINISLEECQVQCRAWTINCLFL